MKVIAMLTVLNEGDVIEETLNHLINQGIELVVLDNGSEDGTFEICKKFLGKGILTLKQFRTDTYIPELNLEMCFHMAISHNPDWIIINDGDELLESYEKKLTLKEEIERADSNGYNLIQFDLFDFFMTDNDNKNSKSVRDRLSYYSYQGDMTYRAWKYFHGIRIIHGHYPIFPNGLKYNISPKKLLLRHYPIRTKKQAQKRVKDRIRKPANNSNTRKLPNLHIENILKFDLTKPMDHHLLTKYNEDDQWNFEKKATFYSGTHVSTTKNNIFSKEGYLKNPEKTTHEYKMETIELKRNLKKLQLDYDTQTIYEFIKRKIRSKLRMH